MWRESGHPHIRASPSFKRDIRQLFASSQATGADWPVRSHLVFPIDGFGQTGLVAHRSFVYVGYSGAATISIKSTVGSAEFAEQPRGSDG
jgi:hypothetical protein